MTVLDTFYLLFKTSNAARTQAEISGIDKQLDELGKKGKKRDEEEDKRYEVLKKQRKELTDQIKDQARESDKLKDSFTGMIESAVGAATAFVSFGAFKAALVDANNLNASLQILHKTLGLNPRALKAYGAALEASTGIKADAFYDFAARNAEDARRKRVPFDLDRFIDNLRGRARQFPEGYAPPEFAQIPGAEALLPFLQLSDEKFRAARESGYGKAGTSADFEAAIENRESGSKLGQAIGKVATQIDTEFRDSIDAASKALEKFVGIFDGNPKIAATESALGTIFATLGSVKLFQWIKGIGSSSEAAGAEGAVATATEAASVTSAAATAAAATAMLATSAGLIWGSSALGAAAGRWLNKSSGTTKPVGNSNKQESIEFWESQGYTPAQAAAWAANEQAESSFNPRALNGSHAGIFQWSSSRRANILAATGIDVLTASHADQLKAAAWEAKNMGLGPLALPTNAAAAASEISNRFEVPSTTPYGLLAEAQKRANIANGIYGQIPFNVPAAGNATKTTNIKIGDVTVNTQATDPAGIAQGFSSEMKNQLRMLASNVDDGEFA